MNREYWVLGGSYADLTFSAMDGLPELYGPFHSYGEALGCWRNRTAETRSQATARYVVVTPASPEKAAFG